MKVSFATGITIILIALALGIGVIVWVYQEKEFMHKQSRLDGAVTAVFLAMEEYAKANDGALPTSLDTLLSDSYLDDLPVNPFTGNSMRLVDEGSYQSSDDVEVKAMRSEIENGQYLFITLTVYRPNGAVLVRYGPSLVNMELLP